MNVGINVGQKRKKVMWWYKEEKSLKTILK